MCGVVLSLSPMLLPFSWQSLMLPVLPADSSRLDLLEVCSVCACDFGREGGGGGGGHGLVRLVREEEPHAASFSLSPPFLLLLCSSCGPAILGQRCLAARVTLRLFTPFQAPVPFVMGVLYKTPDIRARCNSIIRVNVYKDR
jgi:hypothetical protein